MKAWKNDNPWSRGRVFIVDIEYVLFPSPYHRGFLSEFLLLGSQQQGYWLQHTALSFYIKPLSLKMPSRMNELNDFGQLSAQNYGRIVFLLG